MNPTTLARSKVVTKFKPIALISFATALIALAANFGELGGSPDDEPPGNLSLKEPVHPVVLPNPQATREESGETDAAKTRIATYTGRAVCGECHQENFNLHAKHGHASTFFKVADTDVPQILDGKTFDAGEDYGVYSYQKDDAGNLTATIQNGDKPESLPIQFVLGSGHNAQTFLSLLADAEGKTVGIEHRVSCYADQRLGLTVGHENVSPTSPAEMFGMSSDGDVLERCIYCHTTTAKVEKGRVDDLTPHVNCEKCHGPGSEHVRLARKGPDPPPYSVGKDTWDRESEIQLCGDCHRLPRSISQQELREYPDTLARFQPVGMLRSKCYLESEQSFRCSTCHDPHTTNHGKQQKVEHVKTCISCHDQAETTHVICPVSPTANCIHCHMPPIEQKQGIKLHDHWIRVRDR